MSELRSHVVNLYCSWCLQLLILVNVQLTGHRLLCQQNSALSSSSSFKAMFWPDGFAMCSITSPNKTLQTRNAIQCALECRQLQRPQCVGVNYWDTNSTCQLITSFASNLLGYSFQSGCTYFSNLDVVGRNSSIAMCPPGFSIYYAARTCYQAIPTGATWSSAATSCRSLAPGAHLAFVNSSEAQSAIVDQINKVYPTASGAWYIGGQSLDPNPATHSPYYWKLSQTEPVEAFSYTNWASGQPDYSQNLEACVAIIVGPGYQWNDVQCGTILCYVCEYRGQHAFSP